MLNKLRKIQKEQTVWANHNFPNRVPWQPLLGMGEELGELYHAFLKSSQSIRGNSASHQENMKDAVGDLMIFLMDFCSQQGWDVQDELEKTWKQVKKRDWKKFPINGKDK